MYGYYLPTVPLGLSYNPISRSPPFPQKVTTPEKFYGDESEHFQQKKKLMTFIWTYKNLFI